MLPHTTPRSAKYFVGIIFRDDDFRFITPVMPAVLLHASRNAFHFGFLPPAEMMKFRLNAGWLVWRRPLFAMASPAI